MHTATTHSERRARGRPRRLPNQELLLRQEMLLMFLLANPMATNKQAARHLGMSDQWVSLIRNSDMFRADLKKLVERKKEELADNLPTLLQEAASQSLTSTLERLRSGKASERFISDSSHNLMRMLGYGQPAKTEDPPQRHLHLHVTREDLDNARALRSASAPLKLSNGEEHQLVQALEAVADPGDIPPS